MKVHTMLVIGARDMEANAVSVRIHGQGNLGAKPRSEVRADISSRSKIGAPETLRHLINSSVILSGAKP